jgi:N-acetylglucosaminyl-diphospho-decaprenol L-rhamnosyltransferase
MASNVKGRTLVILVNFSTAKLTLECLFSLTSEVFNTYGLCVTLIDNASPDNSLEVLSSTICDRGWTDWVTLVSATGNRGFASGNNIGIFECLRERPEVTRVLLLNPDTIVRPYALQELVKFLDGHPKFGIVGSRLEDPDGTSQLAARRFHGIFNEFDASARCSPLSRLLRRWCIVEPESDVPHECDWLPGASLMIRREVFEKIGLLDEGFFMYFEEVDFCKRAKDAGFRVGYVPQSRVIHLVGQASGITSSGKRPMRRRPTYWFDSRSRYFLRHHGRLGLLAANLAWLCGQSIYHTLRIVRRRLNEDPPYLVWDFLRHMLKPSTWKLPGPPQYPTVIPTHSQESVAAP